MNKRDLISYVAEKTGLKKKDAEAAVNAFLSGITEGLTEGYKVQIAGFGMFEVKERKAHTGRNPKTNEAIQIPVCKVPVFKSGTALKAAVAED